MWKAALNWIFNADGLTPHGFCLLWEPWLIWTMLIANAAVGMAYIAIPVALFKLVRLRSDLCFKPVFYLFSAFILLCGAAHWIDVITLWVPAYRLAALVLIATALVSMATAAAVWWLLPLAVAIPSPTQLEAANRALRDSEDILRMSMDIGRVGSYRRDIRKGLFYCTPEMRLMHGFACDGLPVRESAWLAMLLPEDRERVKSHLDGAYASRSPFVDIEYRFVHPTAGILYFERRCRIEYNAAGQAVQAIGVVIDVTQRQISAQRLAHLAHHDALTGLPNRMQFRQRLAEAIARAGRGEGFALFCADLDNFKDVNDKHGHSAGDALLQAVAARMLAAVRPTDTVARLGGDEFAIIQSRNDDMVCAAELAARLAATLEQPFEIDGAMITAGASIGIAVASAGSTPDQNELLQHADIAMYAAKADGGRRARFFEPAMNADIQSKWRMEADLRHALAHGEFAIYYQPLIDVARQAVCGFEALLRWNHPTEGLVLPDRFMALAESTGLIVSIGDWVLQRACVDAMGWPSRLRVAVNLSAVQFFAGDLAERVGVALARSGLRPERLDLEITESVMLRECNATLETLRTLQGLGISISMDDFGTGYSSLSYLQKFPFERLKIDRSFITRIGEVAQNRSIAQAVVALCVGLGIRPVAEGVETHRELVVLREIGCAELQGYYFSRPCPADQVAAVLERLRCEMEVLVV